MGGIFFFLQFSDILSKIYANKRQRYIHIGEREKKNPLKYRWKRELGEFK